MRSSEEDNMADNLTQDAKDNPWVELGVVTDKDSWAAARVSIQFGGKYPLPSIQFGTLLPGGRFSPHIHPKVVWEGGKGNLDPQANWTIPDSLRHQIAELLRPHLVEGRADAVQDLLNYKLVESKRGSAIVSTASCLKCS
jgi:hypothetical protein